MNRSIQQLALLLLMLLGCSSSHGAKGSGFDLVTMINGDIHNAIVAQESYTLATNFGDITIPSKLIDQLKIGDKSQAQSDLLVTRLGDRFSGRLQQRELTIMRSLDPALPLNVDDIHDITFAPKEIHNLPDQLPDTIELHNGDLFIARVLFESIQFVESSTNREISQSDIHLIDIAQQRDDAPSQIQFTLKNGERFRGRITETTLPVLTRYGIRITIPLQAITSIALQVNSHKSKPAYNYRIKHDTSAVIRDRLPDGSYGPEMLVLPGGSYLRGDLTGDGDNDEKPAQQITLRQFAIGLYEVTFNEYDMYCEENGYTKPDDSEWGRGRRPVINVSWEDAKKYTQWLSQKTGKTYRLPTDAEWEYAARAGTQTRYWWGNDVGNAQGNCENCDGLWDGEMSAPVGRFPANPFGLHDTAGNVFEWVADCYHDTFINAPSDGSAIEKAGCGKRVIRGGAWSFPPKELRSANRWRDFPSRKSDDTGFRIVRELEPH